MDRQAIIQTIGPERYWEASRAAQLAAPYCGNDAPEVEFISDVPLDINDLIWDTDAADTAKVRLLFEIYSDIPCYALLMAAKENSVDLSPAGRDQWWQTVRSILAQDDPGPAGPIAYVLWCDFFEDPQQVNAAWDKLVTGESNARLLERVLAVSGPVPFERKEQLYKRLISDEAWHLAIYRSLLFSNYDVYGQIDKQKARRVLDGLHLPPEIRKSKELRDLRATFSAPVERISA